MSQHERWRAAALKALRLGRGVNWAADITGLPMVFVDRVAREHRIPFAPRGSRPLAGPSAWDRLMRAVPGSWKAA
jgi:hypothetical protein